MRRFELAETRFGEFPSLTLTDTQKGGTLEIARQGAVPLRFQAPSPSGLWDITDGFATPEEMANGSGARSWFMIPFSNRIRDGRYRFRGKDHVLPITQPKTNTAHHGLLKQEPFEIAFTEEEDHAFLLVLQNQSLRPGNTPGYPFAMDVQIRFRFSHLDLGIEIRGKNVGDSPAPFGCGWHPYFRTGPSGIDHLQLAVPAAGTIQTDSRLLPLSGSQACVAFEDDPQMDFAPEKQRALGDLVMDKCFYGLEADSTGFASTRLHDPTNGRTVSLRQEGGFMHVFTGDTLTTRPRRSLALEPVQFMTNAFNRPDCQENLSLGPGESSVFRFGVSAGLEAY